MAGLLHGDYTMDILVPIETSSRELQYKVYLCRLLAEKGFRCFLGSKNQINYLMNYLSGFIYLDKGYHYGESEKIYKKIKKNKGLIVSLDEEGGVDFEDNSTLLGRYSKNFFSEVDYTFLWGSKQYELIKGNLTDLTKVEVTGHPRFEMLKPEYHYLYKYEVDNLIKEHGKFLLINTNMGFGNNIKGDDFVRHNYGERFKKIDQNISFDKVKLELYLNLIKELSLKTNLNIIIRPHPEEDHKPYKDAFGNQKNIKIIFSGSVVPWLLAAQQMIHPDCTTAIESFFLDKPSYSFLPKNYPKDLVTILPVNASKVFVSVSDIIDELKNQSTENAKFDSVNYSLLNDFFSFQNTSISQIVHRLISLGKYRNSINSKISHYLKTKLQFKAIKEHLVSLVYKKKIHQKSKGFNWKKVQKHNNAFIYKNKFANVKKINCKLYMFKL
jgi:surface carbohydrate biosynthesis protein